MKQDGYSHVKPNPYMKKIMMKNRKERRTSVNMIQTYLVFSMYISVYLDCWYN
jgi:hypothetical protein